jgi:hypothetical protein
VKSNQGVNTPSTVQAEIEVGQNGEFVLPENQILTSPDGAEYKIV